MAVREYRCDNIKVVMIIGIVLEHTLLIYGYPRSMELLWASFISWLMPLFTIISGYWFKKRTIKDLCNKYLYPMLLFSAVNFIVGYFFYSPYHKGVHLMGYAMWYLWALFVFAIITPRLICFVHLKWLILCSFIVVVLYGFIPLSGYSLYLANELQLNRIIGFYPFFLLGIMLKTYDLMNRGKNNLLVLGIVFITYLILCSMINGLAYYSGFYLLPNMSIRKLVYIFLSYTLIGLFCLYLIRSVPNKNYRFTKYGARSMNVYLLHMLFVFPMSYGVFSHLPEKSLFVVNVIGVPLLCISLFSDKVEAIMSTILSKRSWILVVIFYLFSIVLVNHTWLFDF